MRLEVHKRFEVFFDGACSLCSKEINMLRSLDRKGRIIFTDISVPDFDAFSHTGVSYTTLMNAIHGRVEGEALIEGVEVFRQLYGRVGLSSVIWLSRMPGLSQALDAGYSLFAKNRLKWTGRCEDETCDINHAHPTGKEVE